MLLALDLSLTSGAAWGAPNGRPSSAVWKLPAGRENLDRAMSCLRLNVMTTCRMHRVEIVCVEASMKVIDREHSEYSAFCLTSLQAVAREAAYSGGARVHLVNCQEWRRHFIGHGNLPGDEAKKLAMQRCGQLGYPYADHNAAEACGVWDWGIAKFYSRSSRLAG